MENKIKKKDSLRLDDIARRFEVPERKAKLAKYIEPEGSATTMDDDGMQQYCICRSSDIDRFMIMCDECEEWFHGDCIKISEKESKHIKYFYCKKCRTKNPFLKVKYHKSKKKEDRERQERKLQKEKKKKKLKRKHSEDKIHKSSSAPVLLMERSKSKYEEDNDSWEPSKPSLKKSASQDKKLHGPKLEVYSSDDELQMEVPKHESETKSNGPFSSSKRGIQTILEGSDDEVVKLNALTVKKSSQEEGKGCGRCENCLRMGDCGLCDVCFDKEKYGRESIRLGCRLRRCTNIPDEHVKKKKTTKNKDHKIKTETKAKDHKKKFRKQKKIVREDDDFDDEGKNVKEKRGNLLQTGPPDHTSPRQCFGPGCTRAALNPSKYCSEICGKRLARNRLLQILPQRIQDWNNRPTVANDNGRLELERIRTRMEQARNELQALESKFRHLEMIIKAGKGLQIDPSKSDVDEESENETDHLIYCVVCGHSVSIKSAVKHMDKCYVKIESQMSFGSVYPTRIEGSQRLFCDVYNEQQLTYCKRLQVLCPEHTKEPKVTANEVCGCPLSCNIYGPDGPTKAEDFCRLARRKCNKHFKWETMYRAEVDLQRIRQWLKIDEIFDEERRIKTAMSNRAGLISLLLHQTTVHDPRCIDMRTKTSEPKKPAYRLMI